MKDKIFKPDFIQVPLQIYNHPKLDELDGMVYGIIYWFDKLKDGKCTASNDTIGSIINKKGCSIANCLTRLENNGFIKRKYSDKKKKHRLEIIPLVSYMMKEVSSTDETVSSTDETRVSSTDEQNKNNINKNNKEYSNAIALRETKQDIQDILDIFYEFNPSVPYSHKAQRDSCIWLIGKYKKEGALKLARACRAIYGQPFAPVITTPYRLKQKIADLGAFLNKQKYSNPLNSISKCYS